jgi:hypothetical protein
LPQRIYIAAKNMTELANDFRVTQDPGGEDRQVEQGQLLEQKPTKETKGEGGRIECRLRRQTR